MRLSQFETSAIFYKFKGTLYEFVFPTVLLVIRMPGTTPFSVNHTALWTSFRPVCVASSILRRAIIWNRFPWVFSHL